MGKRRPLTRNAVKSRLRARYEKPHSKLKHLATPDAWRDEHVRRFNRPQPFITSRAQRASVGLLERLWRGNARAAAAAHPALASWCIISIRRPGVGASVMAFRHHRGAAK